MLLLIAKADVIGRIAEPAGVVGRFALAVLSRELVPANGLGPVLTYADAKPIGAGQRELAAAIAAVGALAIPTRGCEPVLPHAFAVFIHLADVLHRDGV